MAPRMTRLSTVPAGLAILAISTSAYAQSFSLPSDVNLGIGVPPARITGVESADLDGDGRGDIVGTDNANPGLIGYAMGTGGGSYATQAPIATPSSTGAFLPTLGDLDGDGFLDVAISGEHSTLIGHQAVYVAVGSSSGSFSLVGMFGPYDLGLVNSVTDLAITDLDRDGFDDILATVTSGGAGGLAILYGRLPPSPSIPIDFAPVTTSSTGVGAEAVDVCVDFNADGYKDVVVCGWGPGFPWVSIHAGNNTHTPGPVTVLTLPAGTRPRDVHWIDCNQDGRYDIAVAGSGPTPRVVMIRNLGPPTFFGPTSIGPVLPMAREAFSLLRMEVNFDGSEDLTVFTTASGGTMPNTELETLSAVSCSPASVGSISVGSYDSTAVPRSSMQLHAVHDQDVDGREDLVLVDHSTTPSRVRVYKNTAPTDFTIGPARLRHGQVTPINIGIDVPPAFGGRPFVILLSMGGTLPGLNLPGGLHVPLNPPFHPFSISGTLPASGELKIVTPPVALPAVPTAFSAHISAVAVIQGAAVGSIGMTTNPAVITVP